MRILEVITPSRIGGAETYLVSTVKQLLNSGDDVTVFCPAGRPFVDYLLQQDLQPVCWKTSGKIDPWTLYRLVSLIHSHRIDVVHTHLSTASFLGSLAAKIARVPCVATVHGLVDACWYHLPSHVIAVSHAVKDHLITQGVSRENITVVHNGIRLTDYHPHTTEDAKQLCALDPLRPLIGIFGRLAHEKGQDISLHAFKRVLQHFPHAQLLIAGEGKQYEYLAEITRQLGMVANVRFTGFLPDPRIFINACDIVVAPSRTEGLSLAVLEAMALQRPVIATRTGGLVEVVEDEKCGFLIQKESIPALADNIIHLLQHPSLGKQFGEAGRQRVLQHFELVRQVGTARDVLSGDLEEVKLLADTRSQ